MFPILLIAIGIAVLLFGSRLAVLGAAIGALLGAGLLRLLPGEQGIFLTLGIPIGLAVLGFMSAAFMKGIVGIVTLVLGVLAGAAIVFGILDLFGLSFGLLDWVLAFVGALIGAGLVGRFKDWALIILAGLVGALLTTRGLAILMPSLQGALGTLIAILLAGGAIAYQGGLFGKQKSVTQPKAE